MADTIQKREAQLISKILYKVFSIPDELQMRRTVLELIPNLVWCNKASFYLGSSKKDCFMDRPVGYHMDEKLLNQYLDYDQCDYMNGIFINSETEVYRETDYFTEEVRTGTSYFRDLLEPNDMYYSVQISLYYSDILLGVISLFRGKDEEDFSDHELFLLTLIKDHLALRLYQDYTKGENETVPDFMRKYIQDYGLTARETDVVRLIFDGMTNDQMADELNISHYTIQKHISNIYKKLNINSKSQLFRLESEEHRV